MKIEKGILLSVSEKDIVNGVFENSKVTEVADKCCYDMPTLVKVILPKVKKIGSYCFSSNAQLTEVSLPALTTAGSYCFSSNAQLTEVSLPALTTAGSDCFRSNAQLTEVSLPALTTAGSYCFSYNAQLTEVSLPALTTAGSFVAEKNKFFAHGETIKKAVGDLQFKIVAEKLKKEPIHKNTKFTVKYYRLLTGACDLGCRSWMEANKIPYSIVGDETVEKKAITAEELLPLLEKTNAYGLERVRQLITFK